MVQKQGLVNQLKLVDHEIQDIFKGIRNTSGEIEKYRQRIESGPRIEQLYLQVNRGYQEASTSYQNLLQQKMQAEMATGLERSQKGEQFRIHSYPSIPEKPYKPKIAIILFIGFNVALACGFTLAYLKEYLEQACWSSKELESLVELPVLATVPFITTVKTHRWIIFKKVSTACVLLVMGSTLLYALFHLWKSYSTFLTV
jgi:capsular polysaccharide biosynthesis protein